MSRYLSRLLFIMLLCFSVPSFADIQFFPASSPTGGGTALDGIDGDGDAGPPAYQALADGDVGWVVTTGQDACIYVLDDDSNCGADSTESPCPQEIIPDNNPGTKCWVLVGVSAVSFTAIPASAPKLTFNDSDAADGEATIFSQANGAYDTIMYLAVDVAGSETDFVEVDGVSETVDILKPMTLTTSVTMGSAALNEAELEIIDGGTLSTTDLNIIDGISDSGSLTAAELLYVDGVTDAIQTQIDAKAPTASPTFTGIVTFPIAADPTTDADGEMSFDTDGWGSGYDALEIYNGTASTYVVATTASDTPTDGQVPKWNTGGTITWEDDTSGGSEDKISEGDSFVEVIDAGTGEVLIDVDDEDLEIKDGGANQINFTSNTFVDTVDFDMALQANSVSLDAVAAPKMTFNDSDADADGEATIFGQSAGAYDIVMTLAVDVAGTETDFVEIDGVTSTVDILKPLTTTTSITMGSAVLSEAELEILDGATLSTTDINIIDGISDSGSLTAAELLYVDGVTSAIQTQLDGKEASLTDKASLESTLSDVSDVAEADGDVFTGVHDFGGATTFEIWNSTSDMALASAGQIGLQVTDDQLVFHGGAAGEIQGEAAFSLLKHVSLTFDPAGYYDQESTYRSLPLFKVGDDAPEGITITEWRVAYVGGDPTTELDADIICDTTPDFNTAAGATVMDVIDTTAGASTADTGFDSGSCANGANVYIHFGADPMDANVIIAFDLWYYAEED